MESSKIKDDDDDLVTELTKSSVTAGNCQSSLFSLLNFFCSPFLQITFVEEDLQLIS